MFQRDQLREGMSVRSTDGEKLGKVFALGEEDFQIEKGLFFPKDYRVRYADISDINDGEIILLHGKERLSRLSFDDDGTARQAPIGTAAPAVATQATARSTEAVAIPLNREELEITKHDVQTGEVRVHKDVVEEVQTVSVPVRRERVSVERREVSPNQPAMNASFQEETLVVPVHAEELDVQKRVVLDGEVVIHKDVIEEERRVAESVRHEEVNISSPEDDSRRSLSLDPDEPASRRS